MKFLITVLFSLAATIASADELFTKLTSSSALTIKENAGSLELFAEDGSTPYDTIVMWYGKAQSETYSKVQDTAYEGRCFDAEQKTRVTMTAVVFRSRTLENNSGPAFPSLIENKVALIKFDFYPKDFYGDLLKYADRNWKDFSLLSDKSSYLLYNQLGLRGELKKFNDYYVTIGFFSSDVKCADDYAKSYSDYYKEICNKNSGVIPKGTADSACYFYKKLN